MLNVLAKFLVIFIPTCAAAAAGLWLVLKQDGFGRVLGWIVAILFGITAVLEMLILISGLARIGRLQYGAEQKLKELEERDAELFAQGKSFDEVMSQYK